MKPYRIFLDDLRTVKMVYPDQEETSFVIVRTFEAFVKCIKNYGLPEFISFDNDLGEDENGHLLLDGYSAAKWLVYESGLDLKELKFKVHSANPVAKIQIESLLNNYISFLKKDHKNEK